MTELRCIICERLRFKPLFFLVEGDNWYVICAKCVIRIYGNAIAVERGGWEKQVNGDTYLVKVRR